MHSLPLLSFYILYIIYLSPSLSLPLFLSCIRSHLDEHKQQLEVKLAETEQTLLHYESLGPGFMTIAKEYHELLEEIDNKKWALTELRKTQTDK